MTVSCTTISSPIGPLHLESDGSALTGLHIEGSKSPRIDHSCSSSGDRVLSKAAKELHQYFAGKRKSFDIPLATQGTIFQQQIWAQLAHIPYGETRGYGELGAAIGKPTASRAVGGCVGANPIAIIVPCHRVLGSDRRITGFSGGDGITTKRWLLEHEGIEFKH